ncbi:hypothetical protein [Campylobacter jejuni]|uniref:hypothetical protein n=1 Tax=Campylobacter jejuni TaxID=197 RepID=UPI0025A4CDDE|nr:hypothetical protein [Campylobacter jejuni]
MSIFSINDNSNYNSILSQSKANKESKESFKNKKNSQKSVKKIGIKKNKEKTVLCQVSKKPKRLKSVKI